MPRRHQIPVRKPPVVKPGDAESDEIPKLLQEGLALHRQGRFAGAKQIYEKILQKQSNHFDALQLLGAIYMQVKQYEMSLQFFDKALQIAKTNAAVFNNRGITLKELKRFDDALTSYDEALRIKPDYVEALNNRGVILNELKRFDDALTSCDEALRIKPDYAEALNNRGNALQELKRFDDALTSYDEALRIKPDYAKALNNRGNLLKELKRFDDALTSYDEALRIKPDYAETLNNRGVTLQELKRFNDALTSYDEALRIRPDHAEALYNRGNVLKELKRFNDALTSYDEALRIKPEYAETLNNRGVALQEIKRFDDALISYDKALRIKPDYAEALYNRGNALQELKRFADALTSYDEALRIKPDYIEATWNKSLLLILTGNYPDGWRLYEARLNKEETKKIYPRYSQLAWRGQEDIRGKKILIHDEQGLGDSIQFIRYLEKIHQLGADIILEVPKTLADLANTIRTPITVIEKGAQLPAFGAYCPLLSLPYVFETTVDTIPSVVPYLSADRQKISEWDSRLGLKNRKRIGLAWSGSAEHKNDHNRSIPLEIFDCLFKLPVEWHSLQKEYRSEDKNFLDSHPEVNQHQDHLSDLSDTAALIECMDLVISVDTSVAHLAGALAKTTWILLPFIPDYRWMLDREESPWYPTVTLLRQDEERDWKKVILELRTRLEQCFLCQ